MKENGLLIELSLHDDILGPIVTGAHEPQKAAKERLTPVPCKYKICSVNLRNSQFYGVTDAINELPLSKYGSFFKVITTSSFPGFAFRWHSGVLVSYTLRSAPTYRTPQLWRVSEQVFIIRI